MLESFNNPIYFLLKISNFVTADFDPAGNEKHAKIADKLVSENKWEDVFETIKQYVSDNVKTEKQIVNFVNHYMGYGFARKVINYPYQFVAYFFKHFDVDKNWDNGGESIDSFATCILDTCGCIDLGEDPYYDTAKDKKLLDAIEKAN